MSDGPSRTLNMPRAWRRVARSAEIEASSPYEIAVNLGRALIDDCREIPLKLISALRKSFGDGWQNVLGFNEHEKLTALRRHANGSQLGELLVSHAALVAAEGQQGDAALREAMMRTLTDWTTFGARQVEEHHYRETGDGHASKIRTRIESAITLSDLRVLANQCLGIDPAPPLRPAEELAGIEEGPRIEH